MKVQRISVICICMIMLTAASAVSRAQQITNEAWNAFEAEHKAPGMQVVWNKQSDTPSMIKGLAIAPAEILTPPLKESDVQNIIFAFLEKYRELVQITTAAVKVKKIWEFQDKWYATLQTHYNGIPIRRGQIGLSLDAQGNILSYASDYNPKMDVDIRPRITQSAAVRIARRNHRPRPVLPVSPKDVYLMIYQEHARADSTTYKLAWHVFLSTQAGHPGVDRVFIIDAQTGAIIQNYYPHPNSITGTIQGQVYPEHSTGPVVIVPFEHEAVSVDGFTTNTDASGNYTLNPGAGNYTLTTSLEGPFAKVQTYNTTTNTDQDIVHTANVTDPGTHNHTWTTANCAPDDGDGLTIFWHANRLHDDYYQAVLGINWTHWWSGTSQMCYSVNRGTINNAYAGNPIRIYSDDAARNCDIIYHETTHNVLYDMFGGSYIGFPDRYCEAYAFDEGFSDYVACSFNNDPVAGENVLSVTRDCDNTMQYPGTTYNIEGHTGGQLISGVAWDLWDKEGLNKNATDALLFAGLSEMATLASPYYFSDPNHSNYFTSLLTADDNNNNLTDGTPNDRQIFQAFRNHDLLPRDVYCRDAPADDGNVPSSVPFWTSPDIMVDAPPYYVGLGDPPHENPELGDLNKVHIRVRNLGYLNVTQCKVILYWANPSTGLSYPTNWTYVGEATVNNLQPVDTDPNGQKVVINWKPLGTGTGHRCLFVRVECSEDIITEEGSVQNDNNIAQKNITIVDAHKSFFSDFFLNPRPKEIAALRDLKIYFIDAPPGVKTVLHIPGGVKIEGKPVPRRVLKKSTGCLASLFGKTRWEVTAIPADGEIVIPDFSCEQTERVRLHIELPDEGPQGVEFTLRITEEIDGETIGGIDYLVRY